MIILEREHVNRLFSLMVTFAERLVEERELRGLGVEACAQAGGVERTAQYNYENNIRVPKIDYLAKLAAIGFDIQYMVTGIRSTQALNEIEQNLVNCFKRADASKKAAIMAVAESQAEALPKVAKKKPASP